MTKQHYSAESWRSAAREIMMHRYGILIEDCGVDTETMDKAFLAQETPSDFVEHYALKYDLDRI